MRWPDVFGRRHLERRIETLASELESIKANTAQVLTRDEEALDSSRAMGSALDRIEKALGAKPIQPRRRPVWLSLFCLLCLAGAIVAGLFVPAAFTEPAAVSNDPSAVQVLVETEPDVVSSRTTWEARTTIIASYSQGRDPESTYYSIWFPGSLAGKRFVLALSGAAVLTEPQVPDVVDPKFVSQDCRAYAGAAVSSAWTQPCQLISGVIPAASTLGPNGCGYGFTREAENSLVSVNGRSQVSQPIDWAHDLTVLPLFYQYSSDQPVTGYHGFDLRGTFVGMQQGGCKSLTLNHDWQLGDLSAPPDINTPDKLTWRNGNDSIKVTDSHRNAEGVANILLAVAGALAGLAIGFIPVAYNAWREWLLSRQSVR